MTDRETALVVGAGPGLGAALGRRFAGEGMRVALAARNAGSLEGLAADLGGNGGEGRAYACDVSDEAQVEALFERVIGDFAVPDVVVFNAGAFVRKGILETEAEEFERCWRIGCLGGFLVGRAAARAMVGARPGVDPLYRGHRLSQGRGQFPQPRGPQIRPACPGAKHGAGAGAAGPPCGPCSDRRTDPFRAPRGPRQGSAGGRPLGSRRHRRGLPLLASAASQRLDPGVGSSSLDREILTISPNDFGIRCRHDNFRKSHIYRIIPGSPGLPRLRGDVTLGLESIFAVNQFG